MESLKQNKIQPLKKPLRIIFFILFAGAAVIFFMNDKSDIKDANENKITVNGKVLADEDANTGGFKSEELNVPQISFGGEGTLMYAMSDEQKEIVVSNMKSEIFVDKNKKDKKLLVSWETSKPCRCELSYEKAGSTISEALDENNFSLTHTALITPLDSSTTYNYRVTARDRWGNEMQSDKFAIYTGAQEVSILDLIAGAFRDVFGWAVK